MMAFVATVLGSFTTPLRVGTDPASMLWLLPLVVSIAVVYKSTKVYRIQLWPFAKESAVLLGSIIVFIVVAAVILYGITWIVTEQLPSLLDKSAF
jgi:small-conductance mechanosensitive channel